ncbi:MAG: trigger factor [Bacillota bacterium]|nr:trigger factor [Bacillota bacterium]
MKLNKAEKQEKSIVELEIAVSKEEFESAIQKAYHKLAGKFNVPGFRKGKAPLRIIEQMYGKGVFYEEAINLSYPEAYDKAVEEAKLDVVGRADIDIKDLDENGEGYVFTAKVPVKPEVKLGEYKGLKAEKRGVSVSDEDVEEEIKKLQDRASRTETCDRAVKTGDTAVINFEGFIDGVPFEGGKGESYPLVIGSGRFIPGFEEQLVGKSAGEEASVNVTFPEDYNAKELAGKEAVFNCKVLEVKETILPELDDEFAKDVSEFDSISALREDLKKKLIESRQKTADSEFEDKIIDQITEKMEADIPDAMIDRQLDQIVEDFGYRLSNQGIELDAYLKMNQMDRESFKTKFRPQAEHQVKTMIALEKIGELENVVVSDEDIENEYKKLSEKYNMETEKIKGFIGVDSLKKELTVNHTIDLIRDSSVAVAETEKKEAPKAASEKKTAHAKKTTKKEQDRE